ncbi:uncharacterized protein [Cicer arietinum]|uniref:uncharacterized protein n=1 Tax=Cicer arietinum TaxID=3827 RepID=UPI003CC66F81
MLLNPRSPYYLYPEKYPDTVLVAPSLNNTNYYNMSKSMKRALSSKSEVTFVNGSLASPLPSDPNFELWEKCNNMILSWITRTLSPHISQSTVCFDNASELWMDLHD